MKLYGLTLAGCLLACAPLTGVAAEQGELGEHSAASYTITLAIQPSIEIKTVSDITLNITDRNVDASFSKPFCVQGTTPGKYTIIAYGNDQSANAFVLHNADNDMLDYHVAYEGDPVSMTYEALSPGQPSSSFDVQTRSSNCDNSTSFKVTFRSSDLQNAGSGLYTGSLTLLVSPV
ncbi:MAG TPA: hypothetical protein VJ998_06180 [Pseudomonadales bacterium]|nr:hypothetical protein [Pseudomonadales bacterium]